VGGPPLITRQASIRFL